MIIKDIELKKWGNSQGIRIGKEELAEIGEFDTNVTFKMVAGDGKITLIPKKSIQQLWMNFLRIMIVLLWVEKISMIGMILKDGRYFNDGC